VNPILQRHVHIRSNGNAFIVVSCNRPGNAFEQPGDGATAFARAAHHRSRIVCRPLTAPWTAYHLNGGSANPGIACASLAYALCKATPKIILLLSPRNLAPVSYRATPPTVTYLMRRGGHGVSSVTPPPSALRRRGGGQIIAFTLPDTTTTRHALRHRPASRSNAFTWRRRGHACVEHACPSCDHVYTDRNETFLSTMWPSLVRRFHDR